MALYEPLTPDTLLSPDTLLGPDGVYIHTMVAFTVPLHEADADGAPAFHGDIVVPARTTFVSIAPRVTSVSIPPRSTSVVN